MYLFLPLLCKAFQSHVFQNSTTLEQNFDEIILNADDKENLSINFLEHKFVFLKFALFIGCLFVVFFPTILKTQPNF